MVNFLKPKIKAKKSLHASSLGHVMFVTTISMIIFGIVAFGLYGNLTGYIKAATGINKQISYEGRLLDSVGSPVANGSYSIKFVIYDSSTGGSCLWTASGTCGAPSSITVENVTSGYFSIMLGGTGQNAMDLNYNDDTYWLGVTIGSDSEMTPRKRIGSAGYAFNSDTIDGLDSTSFLRSDSVSTSTSQTVFATVPDGLGVHNGSLFINPASASGNYTLLGIAVGASEKLRVDTEGDLFLQGSIYASSTTFFSETTTTAHIYPWISNTYDLGASDAEWRNLYSSGTAYLNQISVSGIATSTFSNGIQLDSGCFLMPDGTCAGAGTSGADTSLSNLSSVAINTSLLPDTINSYDLGSYNLSWKDIYASGTLYSTSVSSTIYDAIGGGATSTLTSDFFRLNARDSEFASGTLYLDNNGSIYTSGTLYTSNGTAATPSITFINDSNSGLYLASDNNIGVSLNGTQYYQLSSGYLYNPGNVAPLSDGSDRKSVV